MADQNEIDKFYDFIYPLAMKAGDLLREGYNGQKEVYQKGVYYDMVTDYDMKIENFLMEEIAKVYPDHKFMGEEESAAKNTTTELTDSPTWIIDPIDGTANFVKQLSHTCVSIGLAVEKDIVLGILVNPIMNEIYTAKKGQGAFLNGEKLSVSKCEKMNNAVIGYEVSLFHSPKVREKHLKRSYYLGSNATRMVSYGSVALALCYVARGSLDAYHIDDMYPWDVAAGMLFIREAGGFVYHVDMKNAQVMRQDLICAGTQKLCEEMHQFIIEADNLKELKFQ